ncbi:MAG: discoidin domain-containing protein, partial [Verrucomicrobiota bacterium]
TYLAAYTGSAVNALTTVTGNDNGPSMGNWSQIGFTPAPGTEYKIQISNYGNGSAGWTMLNFRQPFRPANDYFTNAAPVTLTKSVLGDGSTFEYLLLYGTITNASVETSEPNNGGVSTVWYTWTNDITGPVTIRMDSSFGGNFYVYSGNAVTSLSTIASPVGGLDGKIYCTFNGVAANAYRIQVRCGTGGGAFSLEFSQKANPGNYVTTNDNQTNAFQILPDSIDANNRFVGSANGSATNTTLEPGETNALTALINSGAELNDNYNTNVVGSNSLWWNYTATATRKMATYNQALVACVPMRMGLGYDAFMNLVKPSNPFNENQYLVATTNGTFFTNANSATWFASRPAPGAPFRFEMDYMYVANAGAANGLPSTYNIVIMGNSGYYDPLVIRTTDLMLGAYNNGTFTPYNIVLTQNQEYYLSLECNGGGAATAYTLTVNRTNSSTIYAGIDANSYYPMGLGACGGRVHDLRVYQTSPVNHEAIEVWQGGNLIAIDDDVVVNNCTVGLTYQIRTTPLSYTTDVAAGKIATESSIVNPAANAVDNNNSTYSSTGNDTGAWLMVDLGQSYPINSVEVWNRFDQPSAAYFNVIISDTNSSNPAILTNYAINCGGGAVGWFGADAYVSGGSTWSSGNAIDTSAVTNPAPASVYQSQRYGNFTYTIPNLLTNGSYTVRL